MRLEIPRVPPSLNHLLGSHWRHRAKNSELWRAEIAIAVHQAGGAPATPYPRARVTIERRGRGELDPDNLVGSMKPVIDGLRYARILVDDSPRHLQLTVTQHRTYKLPPRTLIDIQPLETA